MNKLSRLIPLMALMLSVGTSAWADTETYGFQNVSGTYTQSLGNEVTTSSGAAGMKTLEAFGDLVLNNRFALNSGLQDAAKDGGLSISTKKTDGTGMKNITILSVLNLKAGDKVEVTLWSNNANLYVTSGNVKYVNGDTEYSLSKTGKIDENKLQGFTASTDYTATFTMTADGTLDFYHGGSGATTRVRSIIITPMSSGGETGGEKETILYNFKEWAAVGTYESVLGSGVSISSDATNADMKVETAQFCGNSLDGRFALNGTLVAAAKSVGNGLTIVNKKLDGTNVKNINILSVLDLKVGDQVEISLWSNNVSLYVTSGNVKYTNGDTEYVLTKKGKDESNHLQGVAANTDYTVTFTMTSSGTLDLYHGGNGATTRVRSIRITTTKVTDNTLTTTDNNFYSLYLGYDATIPEGLEAYTGKLNTEETQMTLTKIADGIIPAKTGVLVKSPATTGDFTFVHASEVGTATSDINGVLIETPVAALEANGKSVLTLGMLDGMAGFRKPAADVIKANRAYILVDKSKTSEAKGVSIVIDGDTTVISEVKMGKEEDDSLMFNAAGQRVPQNAKGLLIKGGKKFFLK